MAKSLKKEFKGAVYCKHANKWRAKITINHKVIELGYYNTPQEAAKAYEDAAIKNGVEKRAQDSISMEEYQKKYYQEHKEVIKSNKKEYRKKYKEIINAKQKEYYHHDIEKKNKELAKVRAYNLKIKKEVFEYYGNKCECCGEDNIYFLTLDHINNDGCEHRRKTNNGSSTNMYKWVKRNNFPNTIRILCWNCNCGRAQTKDKVCPHKINTKENLFEEEINVYE